MHDLKLFGLNILGYIVIVGFSLRTKPDLVDTHLFEILDYTISDCNWVEEE